MQYQYVTGDSLEIFNDINTINGTFLRASLEGDEVARRRALIDLLDSLDAVLTAAKATL